MLGDLPAPAPDAFWQWCLSASAVVWMGVGVKKLFFRHPPAEAEFANKEEFSEHARDCAEKRDEVKLELKRDVKELDSKLMSVTGDIWRTIREDRNAIDAANEARTQKVLTRLGELEGKIGELRGYVQRTT